MIPLSTSSESLRATSNAAAITTEPIATVVFHYVMRNANNTFSNPPPGKKITSLSGTSEVVICEGPTNSDYMVVVDSVDILNSDTAAHIITVFIDDGANNNLSSFSIMPNETGRYR